jgi:hypothetical protein
MAVYRPPWWHGRPRSGRPKRDYARVERDVMADKPVVLVTRKLPEAVEERLRRNFEPLLNPDDRRLDADELLSRSADAEALLTCATEAWPAAQIERLPTGVRDRDLLGRCRSH